MIVDTRFCGLLAEMGRFFRTEQPAESKTISQGIENDGVEVMGDCGIISSRTVSGCGRTDPKSNEP